MEEVSNQTEKLELELLAQPVLPDGTIPMVVLMEMALKRIFGSVELENIEVLSDGDEYGVKATYYGTRFRFSLPTNENWFEFWLSANGDRLMINQLELFDQLRTWGFKL